MTQAKVVEKLNALYSSDLDCEDAHIEADMLLIKFLAANGFEDVAQSYVNAWSDIGFWHA